MGAMVRLGVGRGEGKPEWDWGSRQECAASGREGGLLFLRLGTGTGDRFFSG